MTGDCRKLGEQERMLHLMHGFGAMIPVQVLHVRGVIDVDLVRRALDWMQRQHALLRAHVRHGALVFSGSSPYIYRQPWLDMTGTAPLPLHEVAAPWEQVFHDEMRRPLPRGATPRLRVSIVRDPADPEMTRLIITVDHAFFDGAAIFLLCRDMLEYIADPAQMEARPVQSTMLPPASDVAQPKKSRSGTRGYQSAIRLPRRRIRGAQRRTRTLLLHLDRTGMDGLREAIKAKKTTLHGALSAAFLLALRHHYGLDTMSCLSSVDLRRLSTPPLPPETMGCYVDVLRTTHRLNADFWAVARDVSFKLISTLATDQEIASFMRMPDMEVYRAEAWPTLTHKRRLDGLGMTTAGDTGLKRVYGNFILEGVGMATSIDLFGPGLLVLAAEREGTLDVSICYAQDALPAEDARQIAKAALTRLRTVDA